MGSRLTTLVPTLNVIHRYRGCIRLMGAAMSSTRFRSAALLAGLTLIAAACGGGDDATFSAPESTAADAATAELEAQLRESGAFDDADFAALSTGEQDCIISALAERPDLAASALAESEPSSSDALELTTIMLECSPDMVRDLLADDSTDNAMLSALSDEQLTCIVDELVADPTALSDAIEGGDGTAMGLALLGCAPEVVAQSMADELGVTVDQAMCLLDDDGAFMQLMLAGDSLAEDDLDNVMTQMMAAFVDCGIDLGDMIDDALTGDAGDSSIDVSGDDYSIDLTEVRADCAAGDLEACDTLFFQSEVGSDDEDFGATCGGTTDGSTAGTCSYVPPSDDELAGYREGCASGDMAACDDLYYGSPIGSDDEQFAITCGGTTDGTEPGGTCSLGG